jgi:C4-dicarboxylate transporter/malic acid transport protein
MGTGGLVNVLYQLSPKLTWLEPYVDILFFLNVILFIVLIVPWTLRWFLHFDKVMADLKHSIVSNFFVTMPVGALILGTNMFGVGRQYFSHDFIQWTGLILWIYAVILILIFGVVVVFNMIHKPNVGHEVTNYSWFITPVASIVVPLLGNLLIKDYIQTSIQTAKFINLTDLVFYGVGAMLFVIFSSIVLQRFISHPMPDSVATPTFWIMLGPIGVGTISLMGLADVSRMLGLLSSTDALKFLALIMWGFGLWTFLFVLAISIRYLVKDKIPFSLSWWAFIFPLAAYTLASYSVYLYTKVDAVYWYVIFLAILLSVLWILTLIRSLIGVYNHKLLLPPTETRR